MVSSLNRPLKISLLLALAVLTPFALVTLYVTITQGSAVHNHLVHRLLEVVIACCSVPFIYFLPFGGRVRAAIAVLLVLILFVATEGYGIWLACAGFQSCM